MRRALAIASIVMLASASVSGWARAGGIDTGKETCLRIGLLVIAVVAAALAVAMSFDPRRPGGVRPAEGVQIIDFKQLFALQSTVSKEQFEQDANSIVPFLELVTNPASCRSRVVETIDLQQHAIRQKVSIEYALPPVPDGADFLFLPISQPRKGELVDRFGLADASGATVTNLSNDETSVLIAIGLRLLLQEASGLPFSGWTTTRDAEIALLELATRRGPQNAPADHDVVDNAIGRVENLDDEGTKDLIRTYTESLMVAYPIVAVVPRGQLAANRVYLQYERTIRPSSERGGILGSLRIGLGLKPSQVFVPLNLALSARSYHLRINGPADKYLEDQQIRCRTCKRLLARDWRGVPPRDGCDHVPIGVTDDSHFHAQARSGQSYLHLYMRGYASRTPLRNLEAVAAFSELPPGSRGACALTALGTTAFLWLTGYLVSRHQTIASFDLPAILLSVPVVAASWFGFAADGASLVGSSLVARLSLIGSAVLAVAGVITYILTPSEDQPHAAVTSSGVGLAGLTNPIWIVLLAISAANLIGSFILFLQLIIDYTKLTRKTDPTSEGYSAR